MSTATKAAKAAKGFAPLSCPFCGSGDENTLNLDLCNLSRIVCGGGCDGEFSPEEALAKAKENLSAWAKVVRMVEIGRGLANETIEE